MTASTQVNQWEISKSASITAVKTGKLTRVQRAFLGTLLIALFFGWSPSNALGYLAPLASLGWYIVYSRSQRALAGALVWVAGWIFLICFYIIWMADFALSSAAIAIVTYSSFAALLVISLHQIRGIRLQEISLRVLRWVVMIEATLGIIQAVYGYTRTGSFYGPNGDYVEGTIHPWLSAELAFSNPMFAVNMAMLLLALAPSVFLKGRGVIAFALGVLSLILSSVLHVIYLLGGAAVLALLLIYPTLFRKKLGILLIVFALLATLVTAQLVGIRFDATRSILERNLQGVTPRGIVIHHAFNGIPREYPLMPLLGVGPGQFSSRAGLIGTGFYFGRPDAPRSIPFLPQSMSPIFRKYVLYAWLEYPRPTGWTGSSTQPFFSWLSIYVEFGGLVFIFIATMVVACVIRLRRLATSFYTRIHAICLSTSIILLFLLGIQENYWEISQAIYIGLLLILLQFANLHAVREKSPHIVA